ncbi:hypothetical protein DL96DRAFT_344817 [Flagelloscypha sp. PMI_526]|nr:hypothetical protein DL96DRAFT_344817 [Flagelloscypha sp. PMI_526]
MPSDEKSGIALLSLDGGRCENLGALTQVHVVEDILNQYEFENSLALGSVKVFDIFDMILGTGTGGLIACMLGPLKMSTKDAKKAYLQIWDTKFWSKSQVSERLQILRHALTSLLDSQTENASDILSTIQMERVENLTPKCKFAVTATTTASAAQPVVLRAYRSRSSSVQCTLLDALLATLAYQEILPPIPLGEEISELFAATTMEHCNPTEALLAEIPSIYKSNFISVVASIGSGCPNRVVPDGHQEFGSAVLDLSKASRTVSKSVKSRFSDRPDSFVRLDVDNFDLLELLQPGKAISYSRAYLVKEETQELMDTLVHSLTTHPKRLDVRHITGRKPEIMEKIANALNLNDITKDVSVLDA